MARRQQHDGRRCRPILLGLLLALAMATAVYKLMAPLFDSRAQGQGHGSGARDRAGAETYADADAEAETCCRGITHRELWGEVVQPGSELKLNSSLECCAACKALCPETGFCSCNSWVHCGDPIGCGDKFGECWLKKQADVMAPEVHAAGRESVWTSGLVYGPKKGIVALETTQGVIHIKLRPDCSPHSVEYFLELVRLRHCAGCQFYRAEGRGDVWDQAGEVTTNGSSTGGPPYALVQGTLAPQGVKFKEIPKEGQLVVKRGMVGWVDGGPDFFVSLANHDEWEPKHTIFGHVLPQDMKLVEGLANLPTFASSWSGVTVAVLQERVRIVKVIRPKQKAFSHQIS